jgi:hypothetical protein
MLKRLAWLALCVCAPLSAAPHIDPQRLQQLANDRFWISLGHYETAKLGGWRSYVSDRKFFLAPMATNTPTMNWRPPCKRCMPRPVSATARPVRLPGPHPLAESAAQLSDLPPGLRRIQEMVQGRLAAQRGDDLPGGLPQQPVVDVRPHLLRIDQADVQPTRPRC